MTNEELIAQVKRLGEHFSQLQHHMAEVDAELALLTYMVMEESDDD